LLREAPAPKTILKGSPAIPTLISIIANSSLARE
jgi:hypothetical protein